MKINTKIVSSLEKVFLEDKIDQFKELTSISMLKGERLSFQLIFKIDDEDEHYRTMVTPEICGELAKYATLREVKNVPVELPLRAKNADDPDYMKKEPGIYPDILCPIGSKNRVVIHHDLMSSMWIDIDLPENANVMGITDFDVLLKNGDNEILSKNSIKIEVINAVLPKQTMYLTQWFYCDSIANYYDLEVWSEKHWQYIENFAKVAHKNGLNLILTPVFTPELDTEVGGERLTTQLVKVTEENGEYSFDFSLVDRWVEMCNRIGIEYFEIAHLFSQWGAKATPKVMATVDGEYKQIFGWDTCSTGDEYKKFLRAFLSEFIAHMKNRGDDKRCFYHISDEPSEDYLENYANCKDMIADLLEGYTIMDALSSFNFWQRGILTTPIPHTEHIDPFIEANVPNLWAYYCGAAKKVSGRAIAMPSWRNRTLGIQLYKYNIVGFLHWGYNFYNSQYSTDEINPFLDSCGNRWVPAGDTYMVYPGKHGECLESLRLLVFNEALMDSRAMKLCETYYSHEEVVNEIEKIAGHEIKFSDGIHDSETMLAIRNRINDMIKAKI